MKNDNIYQLALECKREIDDDSNPTYNRSGRFVRCITISEMQSFMSLCNAIKDKYPKTSSNLRELINSTYTNSCSVIEVVKKLLDCIIDSEKAHVVNKDGARKIFISHSSKDKDIIKNFTDYILELGIGVESSDIFCTSIEDMALKNGEDIRKHIKDNILSADFSFLMVSKHYESSEICLNEMGAVWAANNNVRYYLLPDADFDKIGWLNEPNQFEKLSKAITLDALQKELVEFYNLKDKGITWSRHRDDFLAKIDKGKSL